MYRHSTRIERNYNKPFFSKRRSVGRIYFIGFLSALILLVPFIAMLQFQPLQLAALDAVGMASTPTPFASERAMQGQELFLKGDMLGAERFYSIAVQLQPDNINYIYEYGKVLLELNLYPQAEVLGKHAIEIAPDDPRGYALTANSLVWTDAASAIPYAISGTEVMAEYAPLNSALAIAYSNIGRYQEALQRGDLAVRIDPLDANARRAYSYPLIYTGQYTLAVEQLEQAIAINPNITSPYFELASLYRRLNQDETAVAIFDRLIELDPNNAKAYLRKCETYAAAGLFQEGEPYCEKALDLDPQYADAYRMQGQLRYSRRNYEGSIESFNTCLSLGSEAIECYYIRGLAHYFLGQCDLAWDVLNESLIRVNPELTPVIDSIKQGLENVTVNCAGYQGQLLPTPIPPTAIPPTPIGGL